MFNLCDEELVGGREKASHCHYWRRGQLRSVHTPVMFSLVAVSCEWCLYLRCATPGSRGHTPAPCWSRWWTSSRRQSRSYLDNNGSIRKSRANQEQTYNCQRVTPKHYSLFHPIISKGGLVTSVSAVPRDGCVLRRCVTRSRLCTGPPRLLVTGHCQHVGVSHNRCPAPVTGAGSPDVINSGSHTHIMDTGWYFMLSVN